MQWGSPEGDDDPKVHGFLFNDGSEVFGHGAIAGTCAFRWREWKNRPPSWGLQWIWVAPKARRHGILSRRWPMLRARFGAFVIEPPLSAAMAAFAAKHAVQENTLRNRGSGARVICSTRPTLDSRANEVSRRADVRTYCKKVRPRQYLHRLSCELAAYPQNYRRTKIFVLADRLIENA